jgi:hypothetical protein
MHHTDNICVLFWTELFDRFDNEFVDRTANWLNGRQFVLRSAATKSSCYSVLSPVIRNNCGDVISWSKRNVERDQWVSAVLTAWLGSTCENLSFHCYGSRIYLSCVWIETWDRLINKREILGFATSSCRSSLWSSTTCLSSWCTVRSLAILVARPQEVAIRQPSSQFLVVVILHSSAIVHTR